VQEVASALSGITADQLAGRFDLRAIVRARIYTYGMPPGGVLDEEDVDIDSEHDDIKSIFHELVEYYAEAARSGNGMLLYVR
jgi:hypothetical protein